MYISAMKTLLQLLMLVFLCPCILFAGKDNDMFDKAHELSYEGQMETARQLMEGKAEAESGSVKKPSQDDNWDGTVMFFGMIWGAIGTGYFIYGKKASKAMFLLCGIGLVVLPLLVSDVLYIALSGLAFCLVPFKVEI